MAAKRSRRQRLIGRTAVAAILLVLIGTGFALLKPAPEAYIPGEKIDGVTDGLARSLPPDYPRVRFVDVAIEAGVDFRHFHGVRSGQLPEDMGSGAAWGDYDNDGDLDLYAVNIAGPLTLGAEATAASPAHNALFRNGGDGRFEEVSEAAGVDYRGCGQAAAWGDYDNDGRVDLITTNYGRNVLYRGGEEGVFAETAAAAGIDTAAGFWAGASWGDYDNDGDLDLYICGYVQYRYDPAHMQTQTEQYGSLIPASLNPSTYRPERNLLYGNNGDGTFVERAAEAAVANPEGRSLGAAWCDFDDDGRLDLYVANDLSDNALFINRGDGAFEDISHAAWVADYRGAMGLAVGDWDSDGDQDLFVTHWIAQENAFYDNTTVDYRQAGLVGAPLRFMDVADRFGLGQIALDYVGWGAAFADYDNDTRPDLLVVNGSTFQREDDPSLLVPMRNQLFWNRGPVHGFFEVGAVSGPAFAGEHVGRGLAMGDWDNDGDIDAFVVVNGGRGQLLRNEGGTGGNWLKLRLEGRQSNRSGLGARVRLVVGPQSYVRQTGSNPSYYSQHALGEELFGLGTAGQVDTLEVIWSSGLRQYRTGLAANQTVALVEEAGHPTLGSIR